MKNRLPIDQPSAFGPLPIVVIVETGGVTSCADAMAGAAHATASDTIAAPDASAVH